MSTELRIEMLGIEQILPYKRNAKLHPEKQVEQIAASIREFGFNDPIAIDEDSRVIVEGHGRLMAARLLGMDSVPVIKLNHLSPAQRRAYALAHNKLTMNTAFDVDLLRLEIDDLRTFDDLDLSLTGFGSDELAELLGQDGAGAGDGIEDPGPSPPEEAQKRWKVKPGDLWTIGRHRLLCGDVRSAAAVSRVMQGGVCAAVLTDPPYGIAQPGVPGDVPADHADLMRCFVETLPVKDSVIVAFQSTRTFPALLDAIRARGYKFERMLTLYKEAQCTFPWRGWILISESILVCSSGNPAWNDVHPYHHDAYSVSEVSGEIPDDVGWHGSIKPLSVVLDIMARTSNEGAVVYDPFLGSGTTMVAAEQLGRICCGMEIEPRYCAVILERMARMGLEPKRAQEN